MSSYRILNPWCHLKRLQSKKFIAYCGNCRITHKDPLLAMLFVIQKRLKYPFTIQRKTCYSKRTLREHSLTLRVQIRDNTYIGSCGPYRDSHSRNPILAVYLAIKLALQDEHFYIGHIHSRTSWTGTYQDSYDPIKLHRARLHL